ncbi:MAG: DNA cytosine methyltransferase [Flavobacteriales bacterium]|nr:DNA cytosine methyltransferase [Flavobacteriales bacterium]
MAKARQYTALDLFSGCGGFTLGLQRAGIKVLGAIDFNKEAVETFKLNFPTVPYVTEGDMTVMKPEDVARSIGTHHVDVVVGGPPCQGFSMARQRDGANHGERRLVKDARRELYQEYLRFVDYFQPKVFVMENVLGIKSAEGGKYFSAVQHEARILGKGEGKPGYRVHAQVEHAWELGVPQKRKRQLIIGVRSDLPGYFPTTLKAPNRSVPNITLGPAIMDLPPLRAGAGEEEREYDLALRERSLDKYGELARKYLYDVLQVGITKKLTAHRARRHSERDLGDFKKLKEGQSSAVAMRNGVKFDFPYSTKSFKDRYTRQSRDSQCSTIVAHLSKDGLMFIHPTQNRSITPREAARIQSFPDWFELPVARIHQFRLIGNAVPPLVSEAVGNEVVDFLEQQTTMRKTKTNRTIPNSHEEAVQWLLPVLDLSAKDLKQLDKDEFLRAWRSVAYLYPGLHPDSALDHGPTVEKREEGPNWVMMIEPRLVTPYYRQSGWPVVLKPLADEAWRRDDAGLLADDELYSIEAQYAGMTMPYTA